MRKPFQSIAEAEALTGIHPLLAQTDMVQAFLAEIKTMTRRLRNLKLINERPHHFKFIGFRWDYSITKRKQVWIAQFKEKNGFIHNIPFPYGKVGDIVWIRENFYPVGRKCGEYYYQATEPSAFLQKWKPSIHMPKTACRLFYEITSVKVERLHVISNDDAIAEGIQRWDNIDRWLTDFIQSNTWSGIKREVLEILKDAEKFSFPVYRLYGSAANKENYGITDDPAVSLISLFNTINKPKRENPANPVNNPWLWAIGLKPVSKPINFL